VRYWAASTSFGKDAYISEEKVQAGAKLVTKLWNVAQFSQHFLEGYRSSDFSRSGEPPTLSLADRWILSRTQRLVRRVTELYRDYEYATAKSETEAFFWKDLTDNYLEMAKLRLYEGTPEEADGARWTLHQVFLTVLKLFAPILPYVTEGIYRHLFAPVAASLSPSLGGAPAHERATTRIAPESSIHLSRWPAPDESLEDDWSESVGEELIDIATAVRRYKTEHNLALSSRIERLQVMAPDASLAQALKATISDIISITRADKVEISVQAGTSSLVIQIEGAIAVALEQTKQKKE
jgi:valyl-tRNA synthetase